MKALTVKQPPKPMARTLSRRQAGFSVIDVAIGVAVVAVLSALIFQVGLTLTGRTEITTASTQHNSLKDGIRQMYSADSVYTNINNERVLTSRLAVPTKMRGTGTNIKHVWSLDGSGVVVTPSNSDQTYTITYSNIPGNVCNEFTNSIRETALEVSVNATVVANANDVADNCLSDEDTNALAFTYN